MEIKGGVVGRREELVFIELPGIVMKFRRNVASHAELKCSVTKLLLDNELQSTDYTMTYDDGHVLSMNSEEDFDSSPATITVFVLTI